jgi:hypothetical protein
MNVGKKLRERKGAAFGVKNDTETQNSFNAATVKRFLNPGIVFLLA